MELQHDEHIGSEGKHYALDVVCGMDIIEEKTKHVSDFRGSSYYFCSPSCKKHFDDFPERYVWDEV